MLREFGRIILLLGFFLIVIGAILMFADRIPYIGKLPGDIVIRRKNFTFYFPLATSLIISLLLSILFVVFGRK